MKEKAKAMVTASFLADSLALGAHWIYDTNEIDRRFGRVDRLLGPLPDSYHPTKELGEFTHYGDQTLVLLESVSASSAFDLNDFAERWRQLFKDYKGYIDHATKETLKNFSEGRSPLEAGSHSTDLAGAARIAPIVYRYRGDLPNLLRAAGAQTAMTHNNPAVIQAAEYFGGVTSRVMKGVSPVSAMKEASDEFLQGTPAEESVKKGIDSAHMATRKAVMSFGQSCDIRGALPCTVHLIAKYEMDLKEALIENVMAGGDSAARGLLVGMVLGAHLGPESVPPEWTSAMKRYPRIVDLLEQIDAAEKRGQD